MSDIELWGLIGQIGLVLLVGGFVGWLARRRPHLRDGRRAEILRDTQTHNYPGFEVVSEEDLTSPAPRIRIPQPDDDDNPNIIDGHFA
jgi:hypothetical protein